MHPSLSGFLVALVLLAVATPAAAQQADTTRVDTAFASVIQLNTLPPGHTPDGALWRAAALPGWGQVYNGQYWKLPIVYAGLGALVYSTIYNYQKYRLYKRAHRWKISEERVASGQLEENPFPQDEEAYRKIEARFGTVASTPLRQQRKAFRRNFELSVIGTALFYGLTVVDAYVSAHLLSFEVTDNVALQVTPHPHGATAALRLRF